MEKGNTEDPLLLQVLPSDRELELHPGFSHDPTGDLFAAAGPGILRKYRGRALIITTGSCAIHCRYCFRRHYPYSANRASPGDWGPLLATLGQDKTISEVILSGGDPLMLANEHLGTLIRKLGRLRQVRRLRIHSRLPVVLPARIDSPLINILAAFPAKCTLVLHVNHPAELTPELAASIAPLSAAGITLLNQSVLLRRVNDRLEAQVELCEKLFDCGILPYYLHQLDKVKGAAHFMVTREAAKQLYQAMRENLPGYLLPRLVHEKPGTASKLPF
jgi:EF-P beta-lysylation protein EpmB